MLQARIRGCCVCVDVNCGEKGEGEIAESPEGTGAEGKSSKTQRTEEVWKEGGCVSQA